jgi:hypothetical protein
MLCLTDNVRKLPLTFFWRKRVDVDILIVDVICTPWVILMVAVVVSCYHLISSILAFYLYWLVDDTQWKFSVCCTIPGYCMK